MSYCIVLLMASACPEAPDDLPARCVMDVIGPFPDRTSAAEAAAAFPDWTTPHIMPVSDPADFAEAAAAGQPRGEP